MIYGLFILWLAEKIRHFEILKFFRCLIRNDYFYPVFLIFLGVSISTLFSSDIQTSAGIWKGWFVDPWLFFLVVISTVKTKKQIRDIFSVLTLSGLVIAIIGLWYWLSGNLTYDGRLKAFYLSPNHLAMYLAPCLIIGFGLWQFAKEKWQRILLFIIYCLLFAVLYLAYSYGAWLGLIGAVIFLVMIKYQKAATRERKKIFFYFSILLLLVVFLGLSQFQSEKAQNLLQFSRSSLESRLMVWRVAIETIKDHPLIGIGPGMFQEYYLDYQPKFKPYLEWAVPQPHNLFLAFWLQTGLLGLIGLIWLLICFFRNGFKLLVTGYWLLVTILMAAMIYILIHGLVDTPYWKNDLSVIFWLITALNYKASRLSY
jgi:putative inorganic carbon (HCO3(-)) transporter